MTRPSKTSRREWLAGAAALLGGACAPPPPRPGKPVPAIQSVTGPIPADRLGTTLMHEHVLVDFIGADRVSRSRYDPEAVYAAALPHLRHVRSLGCNTLVECTPAYLGRDPALLKRLSQASGVNILTNTGYYGAAADRHLPRHAFEESADQLAGRWIVEHERGIDGTGIKPAFMKIGVDNAPLSEIDRKLVEAAAIAHRATRLPIASHTGSGAAAVEQVDRLEGAGVPLSAFIWVHAQSERDATFHAQVARRGAWVEFDGVSPASVVRHVELVTAMAAHGLLAHVLVSQDAGWYHVGEPGGGTFRPYDTLFTTFIPGLTAAALPQEQVRQLLVENPRRALAGTW